MGDFFCSIINLFLNLSVVVINLDKMKNLLILLFIIPLAGMAQTQTTVAFDKKYEGLSLYFYKNTLKMLNQKDDKDFDELIKDIEKMRFVMVDKAKSKFEKAEYATLKTGYKAEAYEEVMTGRIEGRNFDVFVREVNGNVKGTVIVASDSSSIFVLDILGKVALNKVSSLFNTLDNSTDIGKRVKDFVSGDENDKKKKKKDEEEEEEEDKDSKKKN
jgi:Domain of unknown function (DUF4252)